MRTIRVNVRFSELIPGQHHVVVHLLQLLLGDLEGVWRGVELVGLEALVTQGDGEGLVFGIWDGTLVDVGRGSVGGDGSDSSNAWSGSWCADSTGCQRGRRSRYSEGARKHDVMSLYVDNYEVAQTGRQKKANSEMLVML